jgi:hypothetical protein
MDRVPKAKFLHLTHRSKAASSKVIRLRLFQKLLNR